MDEPVPPSRPVAPPAPPTHKDRGGLLLFFGLVEILIGALCLLLGAVSFLLLSAGLPQGTAALKTPVLGLWLNLVFYLGAGAFLIVMGVGTIRGKRWARALMLLTSWPALLAILIGAIAAVIMMPSLLELARPAAGQPDVRGAVQVVLLLVFLVFAAIPFAFILFYSGRNVRATFEARDSGPSWVDACPLPILGFAGAVGIYGLFALAALFRGGYGVFGVLLTGWAAVVVIVANSALCFWLAVQVFRMTRAGWFANLAYAFLLHLSGWMTLHRIGIRRLLESAGLPSGTSVEPALFDWAARFAAWFTPVSLVAWVAALVWLRRSYPPGTFVRAPARRVASARR